MTQKKPKTITFSKKAYEDLQARLEELLVLQDEVLERLKTAREMGDLSENGAYKYAKFELGNVRREMREIRYKLEHGKIGTIKTKYSKVEFGATFTLLNDGKKFTYQLTNEFETDPSQHKISWKSPIGAAVNNKKVGDIVVVKTPRGDREFTVVNIE